MYFPSNMTFQYFFFDTYPGYFLEALPIAIIVGVVWWVLRYRKDKETSFSQKVFGSLFVCYMTGLICLVLLFDIMRIAWYTVIYHMESGMSVRLFGGNFKFTLDILNRVTGEMIGNLLMFLPFGILYPLAHPKATFRKSMIVGFLCVVSIEVLQPVFGRALDLNDVVLDSVAVVVATAVYFLVKNLIFNKTVTFHGVGK